MRKLLLLRPEPGLSASAARAARWGWTSSPARCSAIEPVEWEAPDPTEYDALLLTSANAVRQAGRLLQDFAGCRPTPSEMRPLKPRGTAGLQLAGVGRSDIEELARRDSRLAASCCTWRASTGASPQPPIPSTASPSIGPPRSAIPTCRRLRGLSRRSTARAPRRGWPSLRNVARPNRHRRDQRRCRRCVRPRLGAGRGRRTARRHEPAGPRRDAVSHIGARMNRDYPQLDRPAGLGTVAAGGRRRAGDLGPVALGWRRALLRGRAQPAAADRPAAGPRPGSAAARRSISWSSGRCPHRGARDPARAIWKAPPSAAAGSAGRADAMLVAFAARRAIDRGVALGYLEPLLVQRFGGAASGGGRDRHHRVARSGEARQPGRRI